MNRTTEPHIFGAAPRFDAICPAERRVWRPVVRWRQNVNRLRAAARQKCAENVRGNEEFAKKIKDSALDANHAIRSSRSWMFADNYFEKQSEHTNHQSLNLISVLVVDAIFR